MKDFKNTIKERFIRYTTYDTMSNPNAVGVARPTTEGQLVLLAALKEEAEALGLETYLGKEAVLRVLLKGNTEAPTIGFMAHVDTADDVMGNGVKAQTLLYKGGDITLPSSLKIEAHSNPDLAKYIDTEIITSDGTTLLGSDDKAGVAIIMTMLEYLVANKDVKHGDIEVFFTPDEETGAGMNEFPYQMTDSKVIYTIDGADESEVETECFNAASINLTIEGVSIHLGSARGILVNALKIASAIVMALPGAESPEGTDKRFGYYHVGSIEGTSTKANMEIIIRDFDTDSFFSRIKRAEAICNVVNDMYGGKIKVDTHISYRNMGEVNKKVPKAIDAIYDGAKELGLNIHDELIRGGTDGARLAEAKGVPSPNLFTGGHNLHSLTEWVSVEGMNHSANLALEIVNQWTK